MKTRDETPPQNDRKILVYLGTTTPEKIRDYQIICEEKGLPIYIRDVKELLEAFHSSDETTKKFTGNAEDKLEKVHIAVKNLMKEEPAVIENECKKYGIPYVADNIFIATDDGGMHVDEDVWKTVNKEGIANEKLQSININETRPRQGPGVETGPIMSAVGGAQELSRRIIGGAKELGLDPKDVNVEKQVVLFLKAINASKDIDVSGLSTVKLHEPTPEELPDGRLKRISTYHYYRQDGSDQSIANDYKDYLVNHSEQSRAIDALANELGINAISGGAPPLAIPPLKSDFVVGVMPGADNLVATASVAKYLKGHDGEAKGFAVRIPKATLDTRAPAAPTEPLTTRKLLGAIEEVIKDSDGFLLAADKMASPTVPATPETQFDKFYTLFSLMVAKQLIARDMQKPIVIMNHDGSWDEAIANHVHLVNSGLTKDFNVNVPLKLDMIASSGLEPKATADGVSIPIDKLSSKDVEIVAKHLKTSYANTNLEIIADENAITISQPKKFGAHVWETPTPAEITTKIEEITFPEGVHVESNSYFDVIGPKKGHEQPVTNEQAMSVALGVFNKRRETYQHRKTSDDIEYDSDRVAGATSIRPEDSNTFKVAVFCSASCENTKLNDSMKNLGKALVENEFGIVYGAGDRYTMGAVLDGVQDYREKLINQYVRVDGMELTDARDLAKEKAWIAGFSTAPILISETQNGAFSDRLSYYKQTKDIYDRMADMLDNANAVVVAPGGAGTLQEWVAPLMIKKTNPELFKDKPIVIFNPPLFHRVGIKEGEKDRKEQVWNVALKSLLGKDYDLLTSTDQLHQEERKERSKELGIYIETEQEAVQQRLVALRDSIGWTKSDDGKWAKQITDARDGSGREEHQGQVLH